MRGREGEVRKESVGERGEFEREREEESEESEEESEREKRV